jgi:hypothetical protein
MPGYVPDPMLSQKELMLRPYLKAMFIAGVAERCNLRNNQYSDSISNAWYNYTNKLFPDGRDTTIVFNKEMVLLKKSYAELDTDNNLNACKILSSSNELMETDRFKSRVDNDARLIQKDPYAADVKALRIEELTTEKLELLNAAERIFFAAGCKAIPDIGRAEAAAALMRNALIEAHPGDFGAPLFDEIKKYQYAGVSHSKEPHACEYWRQNPDQVLLLRKVVNAKLGIYDPLQ